VDLVSVLVCTRNRPKSLLRTVGAVLADAAPDLELIVMDQSEEADSEQALRTLAADPRLRYTRTRARGKGAALNEGLRLARGAVVACTDDDCVPAPGWAREMANAVLAHPKAAVVFCNVRPEPYDPAEGYVPAYEPARDRVLRSVSDARLGLGLGAGMALRRDAILALGGFDELFGPGSRFGSGDDWDISLRALLTGWEVHEIANVSILHYGFRSWAEGRSHTLRDWIAIGALCAKPLRAGYFSALPLAVWMLTVDALWPPLRDLVMLRQPRGKARIVGFARGFIGGLRTPVDQKTLMYAQ
jgi:glycosyltransferase involved in cell wall biosynthesis